MNVGVSGFLPSQRGLHFPNSFPEGTPALPGIPARIRIPRHGTVALNDASNGLCGGMAFTTIDYFEAGKPPPGDREPPVPNSPLFRHLVKRLLDSWALPDGVLRYVELMNPLVPDGDRPLVHIPRARSRVMLCDEWPRVREQLDGGRLCPLGLIRAKSWSPLRLSDHHQVVAYGYDLGRSEAVLRLYDPNEPDNDDVSMTLVLGDPSRAVPITSSPPGAETYCFFRVPYAPATPPI